MAVAFMLLQALNMKVNGKKGLWKELDVVNGTTKRKIS
jgi:hypothetical protein